MTLLTDIALQQAEMELWEDHTVIRVKLASSISQQMPNLHFHKDKNILKMQ